MSRNSYSARTLSRLIAGTGFTRDVPLGFQTRIIPGVTPTYEFGADGKGSGEGRGATVFDVYCETEEHGIVVEKAAGFKIYRKKDLPVAPVITTGTEKHIEAVVNAAEAGTMLPVIVLVQTKDDDQLWLAHYDLADLVARFGVQPATRGRGKGRGKGKPVVFGPKTQRTKYQPTVGAAKVYEYTYTYLSVNIKAAGLDWQKVNADFDWQQFVGTYY